MKRFGRILVNIVLVLLLVVTVAVVAPNVFGVRTLVVASGSMEPALPVGSLVYVVPTPQRDIRIHDVLSYEADEDTIVTHRVAAIDEKGRYTMKGDANASTDARPLEYENVFGVVKFSLPTVGYALSFVMTTQGKIILVTVVIALIILTFLIGETKPKKRKEDDDATEISDEVPKWENGDTKNENLG
ncbi:MAG: signal peptidase I [Clostridiales Family XIII bacterium]|nr:signal peptidase I [Clostridiales Family XIII bacterium]